MKAFMATEWMNEWDNKHIKTKTCVECPDLHSLTNQVLDQIESSPSPPPLSPQSHYSKISKEEGWIIRIVSDLIYHIILFYFL